MSATITRTGDFFDHTHAEQLRYFLYTGPASYATGGDSLTPEALAMGKLDVVLFEPATNGSVILLVRYVVSSKVVKWFDLAGAEIANATDLSGYTTRGVAFGK